MVTGPSFIDSTFISAPNSPVPTSKPRLRHSAMTFFVQRYGFFGARCLGKAGTARFAVGKERELADYKQLSSRVGGIYVHLPCLVLEYSKSADLVGDLQRFLFLVVLVNAQHDKKALADAAF